MEARIEGPGIAGLAFVLYLLAGRDAFHGHDALALLHAYNCGSSGHENYSFLFPLMRIAQAAVAPFGGGAYQAWLLVSALSTAVGVGCTHAAATRLGMARARAAAAAVIAATMPAVVYYAVIAEAQGYAFGFCGLAWLAMARWATRPTTGAAVVAGLALGFASVAHAMSALVGMTMLPFAAIASPSPTRRDVKAGCATAFACLLLCLLASPLLARATGLCTDAGVSLHNFRAWFDPERTAFATIFWREWFLPFFPASLLLLCLLPMRRSRHAAIAMLATSAPFVIVAWLILAVDERGAYPTMVAGPLAIVVAARLPGWAGAAAAATGLATAFWWCSSLEVPPEVEATADAVRQAAAGRRLAWVIGDAAGPDGRVWQTRYPAFGHIVLADVVAAPPPRLQSILEELDASLAMEARAGRPAIVTSTTLQTIAAIAPVHAGAQRIHQWLNERLGPALADHGTITVFELRTNR